LIGGLTLFGNQPADSKTLYHQFLKKYDPSLIPKYQNLYGISFFPPRQYLEELKQKAGRLCKKYELRTSIIPEHVTTA
jgi:hypothetical protein